MKADERFLSELAGRVSDGSPVDWEREQARAPSERDRRDIAHLRLVEGVAQFHRTVDCDARSRATAHTVDARDEPGPGASPPRWGHLEIREKIGEGTFGEVYRAWDRDLDREVALKLLRGDSAAADDRARRMLDEGRMLARVRHPNVITVHGAQVHDGRVGLWMELIRGRTLAQLVEQHGRFGAREATLIGIELSRALAAVHGAGLVHRDVKAANAMRDEDGRFLLMDFGAGLELDAHGAADGDSLSGTPLYLAPEIFLGRPATARSDLYGMGVLLYHLVTGSYPVTARTLGELEAEHRARRARLLRDRRADLPESFVRVVERALAWEPSERFASAGALERALASSLGLETAADPEVKAARAPRRKPRRAGLALAGVLVAAVLGASAWLIGERGAPRSPERTSPRPPTATAYTVQGTLYRQRDGQRERLAAGDSLQVGDELSFELTASRDLHVYVFNEDEAGDAFTLFPLPGFDLQNPLSAGETHTLPGRRDGAAIRWQVSSAGGREHFIVLASPEPLVEFEAELRRLRLPTLDALALELPAAARERLRGIGGLVEGEDPAPAAGRLFEMARRLSGGAETVEGVWLREIELANPPR